MLLPSILRWRMNDREHLQSDLMTCKATAGTGEIRAD